MLHLVNGDLFSTKAKYLCHQTNCLTSKAAHLASDVFKRYPYADIYSPRGSKVNPYKDEPGNIIIKGNGNDERYVIAILGQYYPGRPRYADSKLDGYKARQRYFYQALLKISNIDNIESIAFPFGISCGAAGGDWDIYFKILQDFAIYLDGKADVFIYQLAK